MIALTILSAGRDSRADHFTNVYFCLFLFFFCIFVLYSVAFSAGAGEWPWRVCKAETYCLRHKVYLVHDIIASVGAWPFSCPQRRVVIGRTEAIRARWDQDRTWRQRTDLRRRRRAVYKCRRRPVYPDQLSSSLFRTGICACSFETVTRLIYLFIYLFIYYKIVF